MATGIQGILFVDTSNSYGGAQRSLHTIISHLDRSQYQPFLLSADDSENGLATILKQSKNTPADVVKLQANNNNNHDAIFSKIPDILVFRKTIRRWLKAYDIKIVYANTYYAGFLCSFSIPRQTPLIFHIRNYILMQTAVDYVVQRSAASITVSDFLKDRWSTLLGGESSRKLKTVYTGFDFDKDIRLGQKYSYRENYDWPRDTQLVTYVADMLPWKRHDLFLNSIEIALKQNEKIFALIVGGVRNQRGYKYLDGLVELCRAKEILDHVAFMEFVENPWTIIESSDVVVSVSDNDPFEDPLIQAFACGKPIVVTDGGSHGEIVKGYNLARTVLADPMKVAEGILYWLDVSNVRKEIKNIAELIEAMKSKYSINTQIKQITALIDEYTS